MRSAEGKIDIKMKANFAMAILCLLMLISGASTGHNHKPVLTTKSGKNSQPAFVDCVTLDESRMVNTPSDCNASNGSIVGLQGANVVGTPVYTWYDDSGNIIGHQADLIGVPAGHYSVKLRDDSKCPGETKGYYVLENNPVSIDNTATVISSPTCNAIDGSITNVTVKGAVSYKWTGPTGNAVTTNKDLTNVGLGTYLLTASNSAGCIAQFRYQVPPGTYAPIMTGYGYSKSGCPNSGTFTATFDMHPNDPTYTYAISNGAGKVYAQGGISYLPNDSTRINVKYMPPDVYTLTTFGSANCVTKHLTFTIEFEPYTIDANNVVIHTDVCGQALGTINGLATKGGPVPDPHDPNPEHSSYWFDSNGKRVGYRTYLAGVPAGTYSVYYINAGGCKSNTLTFTIPDSVAKSSTPDVKDVKMCLPGRTALTVLNNEAGARYRLYDTLKNLIDTNRTGYFIRNVSTTTSYYMVSVNGICESPAAKVTVTVFLPGLSIPNAFTPNNDGVNDNWHVSGLDQYPGTEVSVFNRSSQLVYHSINYNVPFNGRYNGSNLPAGTYYYIIDTKKPGCQGAVTGSVAIIR